MTLDSKVLNVTVCHFLPCDFTTDFICLMTFPVQSHVASYDDSQDKVVTEDDVLAGVLRSIDDQLLIVTVIGPYQVGKSSFISHLTGDSKIEIGNGLEPVTKGVWFYGPYSLNALKQRWQVPEVHDDKTKVIFVDTEGFQGDDVGHSYEENKLLMCQMLSPYIAISQVCLLIHSANIARGSAETLQYFLEVAQQICLGSNTSELGEDQMVVIDVSTGLVRYRTGEKDEEGCPLILKYCPDTNPSSFDDVCSFLQSIQSCRLVGGSPSEMSPDEVEESTVVKHFWPLPPFNMDSSISEQGQSFLAGFSLTAQHLLGVLDALKASHKICGEGAYSSLELFRSHMDSSDLGELAQRARCLAELSTAERILRPVIEDVVTAEKSSLELQIRNLQRRLETFVEDSLELIESHSGVSEGVKRTELWTKQISFARQQLLEARHNLYSILADSKANK